MKQDELRSARLAKGLTLEDSAAALGLSVSQVSRIERGQRGVGAAELARFAALYRRDEARASLSDPRTIPVIAEAAPGRWWEPGVFSCAVPVPPAPGSVAVEEQFAVRVAGRHGEGFHLFDGDFAICARLPAAPRPGELVVLRRRRAELVETTLRRLGADPVGGADEPGVETIVLGRVIARYAPVAG